MKYIWIILFLLCTGCTFEEKKEDYNFIPNNSIRFIRNNDDTSLLMYKDDKYYLLLLGNDNIDIEVDYLVTFRDVLSDVGYNYKYVLKNELVINDIVFKVNDKIEVLFNDMTLCIYIKKLDKDNYLYCDFIYLYDYTDDVYITLSNSLLMLFYHSYSRFSFDFMYHMATVWIDSSTINDNSYVTLTITDDDYTINRTKRRGKTIHKMENS